MRADVEQAGLITAQRTMNQQFLDRDLEPFLVNYHQDATLIKFDGSIYPTPETIRHYYDRLFANPHWVATFTVSKVAMSGPDTAVVVEEATFDIARLRYQLRYFGALTWVRVDGRWLVLHDHLTTIPQPRPTS